MTSYYGVSGATNDGNMDYLKVQGIDAVTTTPEPATFNQIGLGLLIFGMLSPRRKEPKA